MTDQKSLPGMDAEPALFQPEVVPGRPGRLRGYELFVAICPEIEDAARFAGVGSALRTQHGLQGQCLRTPHLHVSLHAVASFKHEILLKAIEAARTACASVVCPQLALVFDRAGSFGRRGHAVKHPFVLRCDASSDAAVAPLRQALAVALRRVRLHPTPSSAPHMTLLYDSQVILEHPIDPIVWTATRFALILSHQGLSHHERVGEWQLA